MTEMLLGRKSYQWDCIDGSIAKLKAAHYDYNVLKF